MVFRRTQKIDELEEMLKHLSIKIRQSNNTHESHHITTDSQPPHY
ncbi:hypothetical protein [Abyssogena phaseoliformis symbiont]|nr:hypothetical protein [Abyssogena phaseoliformis symbiont]